MPPRQSLCSRRAVAEEEEKAQVKSETPEVEDAKASRKARPTKRKAAVEEDGGEVGKAAGKDAKPAAKKTRTAKTKIEDIMPLAKRTAVSSLKRAMYIGAHVSGAGGVQNSVHNAVHIGANAFALFLKSQRKWDNPPLAAEARDAFRSLAKAHDFDAHRHCVPHGSYLVNLAAADRAKADQAYASFVDDLHRCEALGIVLYNFHPGNTNGEDRAEAIGRIAAQLNRAHKATKGTVVTVLENMAGQGNVIGCRFEDLRDIIAQVDDKSRVGVCIDTCHTFAAGYDLRSPEAFAETVKAFDDVVGNKYLRAFHLNDSKAPFDSHRDLHTNIGTGFLGLRAFHNVMNHEPFQGLPMVLETPIDRKGADGKSVEDKQVWADEIKLLESLIGMDPESDEFKALDVKLQAQGEGERNKLQTQADKKGAKDAKKAEKAAKPKEGAATKKKAPAKGKKKAAESSEDESDAPQSE
ncbi:xylose isomerase-like protein [Apiospora hydei]|uniref:Xylose isomerase-like protein n=1 Tax=Apiospora hydei TaxID=1337664 RepID=A0ABR1X138_9PEZI